MKKIIVRINRKTGESKVETTGFVGSGCEEATRELLRKLGKVDKQEYKDEYYQENEQKNTEFI